MLWLVVCELQGIAVMNVRDYLSVSDLTLQFITVTASARSVVFTGVVVILLVSVA